MDILRKKINIWLVLLCALIISVVYILSYFDTKEVTLEKPVITSIDVIEGNTVLKWKIVPYATSYRVFRRVKGNDWELLKAVGSDSLSYTDQEVNDPKYEYSIKACNTSRGHQTVSEFAESESIAGSTLEKPVITSVELIDGNVVIKWNKVPYATSYRVFRRIRGNDWELLKAVGRDISSYTDSNVSNLKYEYSLKVCHSTGGQQVVSEFAEAKAISIKED